MTPRQHSDVRLTVNKRAICIHQRARNGDRDVFFIARRICPRNLWRVAGRKLDLLDSAELLDDLKVPPGNRLEALSADRAGQFSIRINQQYRICFKWTAEGPDSVEIVDYHR